MTCFPRRSLLPLLLALCLQRCTPAQAPAHNFVVQGDHFELDGKPFEVIAGEMHYARIPRAYWRQRIQMAKAMGLNTIATYVFWNVHEPRPGQFDFSGQNDLVTFLKIAQEEHMYVLLRAGPYDCAEWEFGGFPAWLLKDPKMSTALRTSDPAFMVPAERFLRRLAQEVAPLQIGNGGPILATQIENEYGNFGSDHAYMAHWRDIFVSAGFTRSLLYTVDPSKALANGDIPGVYSGVNFGTGRAEAGLAALERSRPGQPLFATEYWPGWFDLWGHPHETRPIAPQIADLEYMLSHHASLNIYMVHGGTSFGLMAGASQSTGAYRGNVTSYDYDAPIDEAGHPTPKFYAYRDVILKYTHQPAQPVPAVAPVVTVAPFPVVYGASLWDTLPAPVQNAQPQTMEQLDQAYGYVLYRKQLPATQTAEALQLTDLRDFALIYLHGRLVGTLDRHYKQDSLTLPAHAAARLDILVENTGRLNSTKQMRFERKGITGANLAGAPVTDWAMYSIPADKPPAAGKPGLAAAPPPRYASATFQLKEVGDMFLDVGALGKGVIWINGHPLGRFWNIGPQRTLYVPGPWLKRGKNEVTLLELLPQTPTPQLAGLAKPILDAPTPGYATDPERKKPEPADAEFGPKLAKP